MLPDDDERQPTAIGHPSDSGDLKNFRIYKAISFNQWKNGIVIDWFHVVLRRIGNISVI